MKNVILFSIVMFAIFGCKSKQQNTGKIPELKPSVNNQSVAALPHAIIYKTTTDYTNNVPVNLSEDKTKIVSYPHPNDVFMGENLALPTQLHNGYLLDNRGIGRNVAFLKYTYEEYSQLKDVPTILDLQENIIDKDPLTELWDCGIKTNAPEMQTQLNKWIDDDLLLDKCKRIK